MKITKIDPISDLTAETVITRIVQGIYGESTLMGDFTERSSICDLQAIVVRGEIEEVIEDLETCSWDKARMEFLDVIYAHVSFMRVKSTAELKEAANTPYDIKSIEQNYPHLLNVIYNCRNETILIKALKRLQCKLRSGSDTKYTAVWRESFVLFRALYEELYAPLQPDLKEMARNNFSKIDMTESDAAITAAVFDRKGVVTEQRPVHIVLPNEEYHGIITVSAKDQYGLDGKEYPVNKYLKSHTFKPLTNADLAPCTEEKLYLFFEQQCKR